MIIELTKRGWQGHAKGCVNGLEFNFYASGATRAEVAKALFLDVKKACEYARSRAWGDVA